MCVDRNNLYGTMKLLYVDEKAYDKNEIELLYVNCERPKTKHEFQHSKRIRTKLVAHVLKMIEMLTKMSRKTYTTCTYFCALKHLQGSNVFELN